MTAGLRSAETKLLERGGELGRIDEVIAALRRGHAGVLVIQGAAGIGKSALLQALCGARRQSRAMLETCG